MQVLEGDEMSVYSLYGKVKRDPRHVDCMILSSRMAERREFPNWFMGYKNISNRFDGTALFGLTKENLARVIPTAPSQEVDVLTRTYAKVSEF